jgi:hypothetical protein
MMTTVAGRGGAGRVLTPLAAVLLAGCAGGAGGSGEPVCPAIGWTNALQVEVTGAWDGPAPASVRVECAPSCGTSVRLEQDPEPVREVTAPLTGTTASVTVDTDGSALASADTGLRWVRTGGSAECGGPMAATVVVPAP